MITERAMLAAIHISIWTAVKHDRKVSREVAGPTRGAVRAPAATTSNCCAAPAGSTTCGRSRGRSGSTSTRSPCRGRTKATACFRRTFTSSSRRACVSLKQSFSKQVDDFLDVYPSYIEHVRPELNGLFREEDYPSADALRKKFGLKLEVLPIPSGDGLPRHHVGRGTGACRPRDRCERASVARKGN